MDGINVCTSSVIHWSWKKFCHMRRILSYFLSASCYKIYTIKQTIMKNNIQKTLKQRASNLWENVFSISSFSVLHIYFLLFPRNSISLLNGLIWNSNVWKELKLKTPKRFGCIIIQLMFSNHFFFKKSITCGLEGLIN